MSFSKVNQALSSARPSEEQRIFSMMKEDMKKLLSNANSEQTFELGYNMGKLVGEMESRGEPEPQLNEAMSNSSSRPAASAAETEGNQSIKVADGVNRNIDQNDIDKEVIKVLQAINSQLCDSLLQGSLDEAVAVVDCFRRTAFSNTCFREELRDLYLSVRREKMISLDAEKGHSWSTSVGGDHLNENTVAETGFDPYQELTAKVVELHLRMQEMIDAEDELA